MTCPRPGCGALILRVERCEEFRIVRYRWACASGHSGFFEADLPEYGRPVEPWGRRGRPHGPGAECGECHQPLPAGSTPSRQFHAACAVARNARSVRTYDLARQAERRSPRRKTA